MSLTVYPTENYDSFVSVTEADTYFANKLRGTVWDSADISEREAALRQAFIRINLLNLSSIALIADEGLTKLKAAQTEQAIHELRYDLDSASGGITAVDLDGVKVNWNKSQVQQYPDIVLGLLRNFIQMKIVKVVR